MTEVVAALLWDGNRFLICQRPAHKARGLLWEFVGGKIEPGETGPEALIRECREELAVTVKVGDIFMEVTHAYPDLTVHLTLYHASIVDGFPRLLEHCDLRWITVGEIDGYPFCQADEEILAELKKRMAVTDRIFALQDPKYREFQAKLMPTISKDTIIGVRVPQLRKLAKTLSGTAEVEDFLRLLPHRYYDENNLHAFLISQLKDFDKVIGELNRFLPYVDNWATCDSMRPIVFSRHLPELLGWIKIWMASDAAYTVRFGIEMLMTYYLDEAFRPEYLTWVAEVRHTDYYVRMMVAWYFATALAKQPDFAMPYLEQKRLESWIHNKTIQKAIESNRISQEQKAYLRTLRRAKV